MAATRGSVMIGGSLEICGRVRRGEFELDVDIAAVPGEVVALLGPNGAGKSTLLRVVAGLMTLDAGSVVLDSAVLDDPQRGRYVPPQERRLGVVFQDHRLFPHLRVLDNVAFGLRSRGVRPRAARVAAAEWLDRLGLAGLRRRYPRELSGGQAQRVALARALAWDPDALLLDEPLASLDVQTRAEVQGELRQHLAAFSRPVVLVTHDPIEALLLASRIVVLEDGRVVQQGSAAEITSRPLTTYVAHLVGMNLYRGVGSQHVVQLSGGGSFVTADAPDGAVLVAVRPSAFTVHTLRPDHLSARNVWSGQIESMAPLGDRVRMTVVGEQRSIVDLTAAAIAELDLAPGKQVWLSAKASDAVSYRAD